MRKRIYQGLFILLLAVTICLGSASAVLAADIEQNADGSYTVTTQEQLKEYLAAEKSVKLGSDITLTENIIINGSKVSIDGQSKYSLISKANSAERVFTDASTTEMGTITFKNMKNIQLENGKYGMTFKYHHLILDNSNLNAKNMISTVILTEYNDEYHYANLTINRSNINIQDGVKQSSQTNWREFPAGISTSGEAKITNSDVTIKNVYSSLLLYGSYGLPTTITNSTVNLLDFLETGMYVDTDVALENSTLNVKTDSKDASSGIHVKGLFSVKNSSNVNLDIQKSTYVPGEGFDGTFYCGGIEVDNANLNAVTNKTLFVYGGTIIKGANTSFKVTTPGPAISGFGKLEVDGVKNLDLTNTNGGPALNISKTVTINGESFKVYRSTDFDDPVYSYKDAAFTYAPPKPIYDGSSGDGPGSVIGHTDPEYTDISEDAIVKLGVLSEYSRLVIEPLKEDNGTEEESSKNEPTEKEQTKEPTKEETDKTQNTGTNDNTSDQNTPQTGDMTFPIIFLIIIACAGIIVMKKVKKSE